MIGVVRRKDKELTIENLGKLIVTLDKHIANNEDKISVLIARDFKTAIKKKIDSFTVDK